MPFNKPCLICGKLSKGSRCEEHQKELDQRKQAAKEKDPTYQAKKATLYGGSYRRYAKAVKANATECWICKKPFTIEDKIDADHVVPGDPTSPLMPAHARCNRSRGNQIIE